MGGNNFLRMIQLADDVFAVKNDPAQLEVNEQVIKHLQKLHPASVSDKNDANGPIAWLLLIPTTDELMHNFISGEINEKQLFELTPVGMPYDAIYLCSVMILDEYRRKGIAKEMTIKAIGKIRRDHKIKTLFTWNFTVEGDKLSEIIAKSVALPLLKKKYESN